MIMSEKCKQHVDSCRFCWMCHHICPIGSATGQERNTARARALGISLVNRGAMQLSEIIDNVYECALCGACVHDCTTGWDPVMFTKETRLQAALDGALPEYILTLVQNCLSVGNAYGKTETDGALAAAIAAHAEQTDTLLLLGTDARYMAPDLACKAIAVTEKTGTAFTVLADEPASGAQLDFLIGAANETKEQMNACAAVLNGYRTVIVYDPEDAKTIRQTWREYGIETAAEVITFTAFLAARIADGSLAVKNSGRAVVFQDPCRLARDLGETEEARSILAACAAPGEMYLNRAETVWAGSLLMAQYMPEVVRLAAQRRLGNASSIGADTVVTASPAEYVAMHSAADGICVLPLEDLILGE